MLALDCALNVLLLCNMPNLCYRPYLFIIPLKATLSDYIIQNDLSSAILTCAKVLVPHAFDARCSVGKYTKPNL